MSDYFDHLFVYCGPRKRGLARAEAQLAQVGLHFTGLMLVFDTCVLYGRWKAGIKGASPLVDEERIRPVCDFLLSVL